MRLQRMFALAVVGIALSSAHAQVSFEQQMAHKTQPAEPLDINAATGAQLNALPGFGPAYTRRILAGRPYTAKNQLVTRGIIPKEAYERVSALIVAHRLPAAQRTTFPHPPK